MHVHMPVYHTKAYYMSRWYAYADIACSQTADTLRCLLLFVLAPLVDHVM